MKHEARIKNILIFFIISVMTLNVAGCPSLIFAQDKTATQEATQSPTLSQKLDELKKEIASKAAQMKLEVNKKLENKAYVGVVLSNDGNLLKIQTNKGVQSISLNEYTIFDSKTKIKPKVKLTSKSIAADDYIAGLGDIDDKGVLIAKKFVRLDKRATDSAKIFWGTVESRENNLIRIKTPFHDLINLITTEKTKFFKGGEDGNLADAKKEQLIVAKGEEQADGSIKTRFIYFVSSGTAISNKKTATPAATKKP